MKLYFNDSDGKFRVVDTGDFEVDLSKQKPLRQWLELESNIRVKSPILSCHTAKATVPEPEVA